MDNRTKPALKYLLFSTWLLFI